MFEIGQKVVCVDDKFDDWMVKLYLQLPTKDVVYVIRDVRIGVAFSEGKRTGAVSVLLIDLVNPEADSKAHLERGFNSERFRPLQSLREEFMLARFDPKYQEICRPVQITWKEDDEEAIPVKV